MSDEKKAVDIVLFEGPMWDGRPVKVTRRDDDARVDVGDFSFTLDASLLVDLSGILCMATDKMIALDKGNIGDLQDVEKAIAERNKEVAEDHARECPDCGGESEE